MAEWVEWVQWAPAWQTPEGGACALHIVPYVDCLTHKFPNKHGCLCLVDSEGGCNSGDVDVLSSAHLVNNKESEGMGSADCRPQTRRRRQQEGDM